MKQLSSLSYALGVFNIITKLRRMKAKGKELPNLGERQKSPLGTSKGAFPLNDKSALG